MPITKANANVKIDAEAKRNCLKEIELTTDEDGNILVDKKMYPEVYGWGEMVEPV